MPHYLVRPILTKIMPKNKTAPASQLIGFAKSKCDVDGNFPPSLVQKIRTILFGSRHGDGENINVVDENGWTALMHTTQQSNVKLVECLLNRDNVLLTLHNAQLNDVRMAVNADVAKRGGLSHRKMRSSELPLPTEQELPADKKADVNISGKYGWTALMAAAKNGNVEILGLLLDAGANIDASTTSARILYDYGLTPLMIAVENNRIGAVEFLLAKGADLVICTKSSRTALGGRTALGIAIKQGNFEIEKILRTKLQEKFPETAIIPNTEAQNVAPSQTSRGDNSSLQTYFRRMSSSVAPSSVPPIVKTPDSEKDANMSEDPSPSSNPSILVGKPSSESPHAQISIPTELSSPRQIDRTASEMQVVSLSTTLSSICTSAVTSLESSPRPEERQTRAGGGQITDRSNISYPLFAFLPTNLSPRTSSSENSPSQTPRSDSEEIAIKNTHNEKPEEWVKVAKGNPEYELALQILDFARSGNVENIRNLLGKTPSTPIDVDFYLPSEGFTPLMHAAYRGEKEMVECFVNAGADVNLADNVGQTALMHAIYRRSERGDRFSFAGRSGCNYYRPTWLQCS